MWACRQWKRTVYGWQSEIDVFDTIEEAIQQGESFRANIARDDWEREYEVTETREG